jgi:hypothetical protein
MVTEPNVFGPSGSRRVILSPVLPSSTMDWRPCSFTPNTVTPVGVGVCVCRARVYAVRCCFGVTQALESVKTPETPVTIRETGTANGTEVDVDVF